MKLKTLNETLNHTLAHFSEGARRVILEQPHVYVVDPPDELSFLRGNLVDLGLEDMGLPEHEWRNLSKEIRGEGVRIPGTKFRIRQTRLTTAVIEPATGTEPQLPHNWASAVVVLGDGDSANWIGDRVREDRRMGFNTSDMEVTSGGVRRYTKDNPHSWS